MVGFVAVAAPFQIPPPLGWLPSQASVEGTGLYPQAFVLYAAGVFWTLGYDTIYALQDLEDDTLAGVKSAARRLGRRTRPAVGLFYGASSLLALWAGYNLGPLFYIGLAAFSAHLAWQASRLRLDEPSLALRLFKSNTWAGLILFAALALGAWWRP